MLKIGYPWTLSHPTGVRGLKCMSGDEFSHSAWPHPTGVRGLKSDESAAYAFRRGSHPTGVRGLK